METAAITAFRYLVRELTAYQAPANLIQLAQAAVKEETRHAHMAGLLSQACDTVVPVVEVADAAQLFQQLRTQLWNERVA